MSDPAQAKPAVHQAAAESILLRARHRLSMGIGFSTLMLGVSYACNFLLVPVMLGAWGPTGYGVWVGLLAVVSYLGLFDLGGQVYVQNLLAGSFARGDRAAFRTTLSEAMALYLWLGALALAVWITALILGRFLAVPVLGRPLNPTEFWVLLSLGTNQFLVSIPFGVFATVYRASGHYTRATFLANFNKLLLFAMSLGILLMGAGQEMLAGAYLIGGIIAAVSLLVDSRNVVPDLLPLNLGWASARAGIRLVKGSLFNWLIAVANLFNQSALLLLVAKFATPEIVALLATHRTIAAIATYVPGIVSGPIQPELSYLWSLAQSDRFQRMLIRSLVSVMLATGGAALVVYAGAPLIFERWTSGHVSLDGTLLTLLLMQAVTGTGATVIGWALVASNQHRAYSITCLIYALVFAGSLMLVVPVWGLRGALLANLILDGVYLAIVLPMLSSSVLRISAGAIVRAAGTALALIASVALLIWCVTTALPPLAGTATALAMLAAAGILVLARLRQRWADTTTESAKP